MDDFGHWGLHCEPASRVSSSCEVKATTGEERGKGGGSGERVEEGIRTPNQREQQLTSWLKPGLTGTGTGTHSHGCTYVLTSSAGEKNHHAHIHTQPRLAIAIKF